MLTPDDVHHNRTQSVLEQRGRTLQAAWTRHPERFVRGIPTTGSPSPSRLDQPTCDTHNRRNCSVNRNRHCLKVVDRFRTGIPVSIGVGPTKTLAKLANRLAKSSPRTGGVLDLANNPAWIEPALSRTAAGDIWGIGPRRAKVLTDAGHRNGTRSSRRAGRLGT